MELIILTGMSGAGKSQACHVLEDIGYYCITNLPVRLIPSFAEHYLSTADRGQKLAFVMDVRGDGEGRAEFDAFLSYRSEIEARGCSVKILFLECSESVLVNRYKETRRVHPLVALKGLTVSEALVEERKILSPIKAHADYCIDTTSTTTAQLRDRLLGILNVSVSDKIVVNCVSFGFKYGTPADADLVFDVRCFPNPYWVEELRSLTGLDEPVKAYLNRHGVISDFLTRLYDMLDFLLPLYMEEGKNQLTVAIGCTGGKHRSVAFAESLGEHLRTKGFKAVTQHRDIIKKFTGDK